MEMSTNSPIFIHLDRSLPLSFICCDIAPSVGLTSEKIESGRGILPRPEKVNSDELTLSQIKRAVSVFTVREIMCTTFLFLDVSIRFKFFSFPNNFIKKRLSFLLFCFSYTLILIFKKRIMSYLQMHLGVCLSIRLCVIFKGWSAVSYLLGTIDRISKTCSLGVWYWKIVRRADSVSVAEIGIISWT